MEPIWIQCNDGDLSVTTEVSIRQGDIVVFAPTKEEAVEKWNKIAEKENAKWEAFRELLRGD